MTPSLEWISDDEKRLVDQLRERVRNNLAEGESSKPEDDQDAFLLRWLRARDLDLDKAEKMLLSALTWQKENEVDKILEREIDPVLAGTYRFTHVGSDKDLRPGSDWDLRKLVGLGKVEEFDHYINYFLKSLEHEVNNQNAKRIAGCPPVTQFLCICEVGNYPYGQMLSFAAMKKWFTIAARYEAYYPEILYHVIFLNCPWFFQHLISMFKGIFARRTLEKFICYQSLEEWKKDVEQFVDPAILPEQYGGTKKTYT